MKIINLLMGGMMIAACSAGCNHATSYKIVMRDSLQRQAITELWLNLRTQPKLVKVHTAEFILWLGLDSTGEVHTVFTGEQERHGTESPYRVPVWRVLAQAEKDPQQKQRWIEKIFSAYTDTAAIDRVHAAESLAKLKVSPMQAYPAITQTALNGVKGPLSTYTFFGVSTAITNPDSIRANRAAWLQMITIEPDDHIRAIAAYALRHLGQLTPDEWRRLAESTLAKPAGPKFQVYLLSAAFVTAPQDSTISPIYVKVRETLLQLKNSSGKDDRMEMAAALARRGTPAEIPLLMDLLNTINPLPDSTNTTNPGKSPDNADVRSVAAYALLKIDRMADQPSTK